VHDFIWQKACFNVAMNALSGLVSASPGMLNHALNGYIVDLADKLAVDAPINRMLARLVRLKEAAPEFWAS